MLNNRKQTGILLIVLGLLFLLVILYFILAKSPSVAPKLEPDIASSSASLPSSSTNGTTTPSDKPLDGRQYDISKEKPLPVGAADLAKRAMLYSERFGSYSNQSDYGNFTDLKIFMTASFREWVDKYVADLKKNPQAVEGYYGIETKALTTELKSFADKDGTAEITVTTERRESNSQIGGGEPYIQKIDFGFVKVGSDWLIDKAYWQKNK
ncbi:MAG: hypothetical protein WC863_00700 [Patescibacteria group bacterium]